MARRWVWIMAIGLVFAGGAWNFADGIAFDLTKLKSICVSIDSFPSQATQLGLSENEIGNHVYVWLKGKLPRAKVERYPTTDTGVCAVSASHLWVNINIAFLDDRKGFYGVVEISVVRKTTWESDEIGIGIAYLQNFRIRGPIGQAAQQVKNVLDQILTDFAAEYYKAGNP